MKNNKNTLRQKFIILFASFVMASFWPWPVYSGKNNDPKVLTLERIFNADEFRAKQFGPVDWLNFKNGYTTLENSASMPKGNDIVFYQPGSPAKKILVPAAKLIPQGQTEPLSVFDYHWSTDGSKVLIFTNAKKVWRRNTRGDYWVLDLRKNTLVKLGGDGEESSLMFAKFSPDANRVAYVRHHNIYVENLGNGQIIPLTQDGSKTIINGTFDWVYEEELNLRDGFRWSPDGHWIAYWQLDSEGIPLFYLINNTDSLYPKLTEIPYPKPGQTNSAARIGIINSQGGLTRWIELPENSRDYYLARMDWAGNSREIFIQRLNRRQNTVWLMLAQAQSGQANIIHTESDDAWVDVNDEILWVDEGKSFLWLSEKDGWRHLYLISRDGRDEKLLTRGNYDVISLGKTDEKNNRVYFMASPENPQQQYLYNVPLNGSGKMEKITPVKQTGSHQYEFSPGADWAIHSYSAFDQPPTIELVKLPGHKTIRILENNSSLKEKVSQLDMGGVEFFQVDIGNHIKLDGWCLKPVDFSPAKKYPVLFYIYGEPAGQTVVDRWGGSRFLWHQMLTQQGYLVMSIDNRGTPAAKGRLWRKIIKGQVGILASQDQAAALQILLKERPYMDSQRIGIWGWSGGGSMSLNMIFRYPDLYQTAMAVAFVADQNLYDSIYQERYMGLPADNPEGYKNGSPITFAHQLKGNLLIIHGTGDDNVHYQNCERLINELVKHDKVFTMMAYPNRSHGIYEGENTTFHLYQLLTRYLKEHLPALPAQEK